MLNPLKSFNHTIHVKINYLTILYLISGSRDKEVQFTRKETFIMIKNRLNSNFNVTIKNLENQLSEKSGCSIKIFTDDLKLALSKLFYTMRTKWQSVHRTEENFFKKYDEWLSASLSFPVSAVIQNTPKNKVGRPS